MRIPIDEIQVKDGRRSVDLLKVSELCASIREVGLINPITVGRDYSLIAGAHRLAAAKMLNWGEIEANIVDLTGLAAELAEIDENLIRNELHYIDAAKQIARRKDIYEEMHPETVARNKKGHTSNHKSSSEMISFEDVPTFTTDTAEKLDVSRRTVEQAVQIAENLVPEVADAVKEADVPKTAALKLARMEPERQREVIELVQERSISVDEAERKIKKDELIAAREQEIEAIRENIPDMPTGKYQCIVIDPPWSYGTKYSPDGRRVANPYPEMTQEELFELDVLSDTDCILFLWTTHKFIWDAKELLEHWGFSYRSMIVWDKDKMGMGDLFRMQCEFCLVGIKGNPILDNPHNLRDIIREPRREHSRKPEAFYEMVDNLCVGTKIEYFSRTQRKGWTPFGNDTNKFKLE